MRVGVLHGNPAETGRLSQALARSGCKPVGFTTGTALANAVANDDFDALLMRWDGHDLCGVALMHRLRSRLPQPPAMLLLLDGSAPGGIGEGADAVLDDPCDEETLAAVLAQLAGRRGMGAAPVEQFGDLVFDRNAGHVLVRGHPVLLTAKEFALAQLILRHAGQALSRDFIMANVWGRQDQPGSRTLDAHIAQVRKRLMLRPEHGWRLSSVYGFGYRLDRVKGEG